MARLGGDEFAVILPSCAPESALTVVRRLCIGIREGRSCSAGVASWDGHETPYELVARADASLYEAKEAGRGRVLVAGPTDPG
jgi:diguanylate cyclase (GGDEF)-like protein